MGEMRPPMPHAIVPVRLRIVQPSTPETRNIA
jgi:hypothetical protein